jgi:hypothetical protein
MEDLTKFIKPLNAQTSWADAVDDDSSDDELIVSDSREAFGEENDTELSGNGGLDKVVQNSAKVVQGVSFASLLRSNTGQEREQEQLKSEPTVERKEVVMPVAKVVEDVKTATLQVPKAPAVNPWKKNIKPAVSNVAMVNNEKEEKEEKKELKTTPESTEAKVLSPKTFTKVTPGVSFLNKVLAGQEPKKPEFTFKLSGAPTKPLASNSKKNTAPVNLSLDSSRDGLNLLFSQVVKTNTDGMSTPKTATSSSSSFGLGTIAEDSGTPKGGLPFVPQQLTEQRIVKRQRQIDIGKSSIGYQNYIQKVPKEIRIKGEIRHPTTPNKNEQISKRRFDGKMSDWRRTLHLWDDVNVNPMEISIENVASNVSPRTEQKKSKAGQQLLGATNHGIKRKATKTPHGATNKKKVSKIELENVSLFPSLKNV